MSLFASSIVQKFSKVLSKNPKAGKHLLVPTHQQDGFVYIPTVRSLPSTFSPTMFSSATKHSSDIPSIDFIEHILMRIEIVVATAPVVLTPVDYWFREMALRDSATEGLVQIHYDDTVHANLLNKCSVGRERAIFKTVNMESSTNGKYGLTNPLPVGRHVFFVPLLASAFSALGGIYLLNLQGNLKIDVTTPSTIIASGSGTITSSVSFTVEGKQLNESDRKAYMDRYRLTYTSSRYLQPHRSEFLNKTLTAGTSNRFRLADVDGLCAYQMLLVRPTGSYGNNANFASWRLLNVGDSNGASLDLTNSSDQTYIGGARPTRFIRQHQGIDHMDNDWWSVKPAYHLLYTDSIPAALQGAVSGARLFTGTDGDQIVLNLPASPVQEVQTVTFSAAPNAAGFYSFTYKGEQSGQIATSADVSLMKTTLENMKCFASRYITVTCSAAASAGTSFTITFADPEGELTGDLVQVNSHDGIVASASTARTVAGIPGLASGDYDVVIYSYLYHEVHYSGTQLTSRKLML